MFERPYRNGFVTERPIVFFRHTQGRSPHGFSIRPSPLNDSPFACIKFIRNYVMIQTGAFIDFMNKTVIITGSTGMVGKAVLLACLEDPFISKVCLINRHPINMKDPKIIEILHPDFSNFDSIKTQLMGFDACFHCMGVSSIGMSEPRYRYATFTITQKLATTLYDIAPHMTFVYVSGAGTDRSEKGPIMWSRIKGKTENMLVRMGFNDVYAFRPNAILPEHGVRSKVGWINLVYFLLKPFYSILRQFPSITTSSTLGRAMIQVLRKPHPKKILENPDINHIGKRSHV